MSNTTLEEIINRGDLNNLCAVLKAGRVGSILAGQGGLRLVRESVAVASNAATPSYTIKALLRAKVSGGSSGNGEKVCQACGETAVRLVRETGVAVASAACAPAFAVEQLLYAKTIGTGAAAVKSALINGATPSAGQAAPNAGGTSVAFHAETTGTGTATLDYLTTGGVAVPNAGGTSIAFNASEVAGASAVVELEYLTADPPKDADGVAATALTSSATGLY